MRVGIVSTGPTARARLRAGAPHALVWVTYAAATQLLAAPLLRGRSQLSAVAAAALAPAAIRQARVYAGVAPAAH